MRYLVIFLKITIGWKIRHIFGKCFVFQQINSISDAKSYDIYQNNNVCLRVKLTNYDINSMNKEEQTKISHKGKEHRQQTAIKLKYLQKHQIRLNKFELKENNRNLNK